MSHTHRSRTPSRRNLPGSLRSSRPRKHARLRHRHLQTERLEDRRLLAYDGLELNALLSANGANLSPADPPTILWQGEQRAVNPGHWIVAMDGLSTSPARQLTLGSQLLQQHASGGALRALRGLGGQGSLLIETAPNASYSEVMTSLVGLPGLRYVEPDFIVSLDISTPNDPSYPNLYGLDNTGQIGGAADADIDAAEAWDLTIGSRSVVVGVIDTGVDYTHPDLAANIWKNLGETAGDGIDNDGNGYIDDVHGYDFVNNDGDPMDDNGHGTHVSGTIGAVGNNAIGVTGINWQIQVMALKFLSAGGSGSTSAAVSALNYATMMRNNYGVDIRLTNNSWGGGAFSQSLSDAIAATGNAGMLFVAAAGNSAADNDATPYYPASYDLPNVIVVAATDQNDALASFSNYGVTTVDLAAPGVNILSTYPGNKYSSLSGTSMATPHVSGAAALAWSYAPSATDEQIRSALLAGVDKLANFNGRMVTGGRLNACSTLNVFPSDVGDTLATARATRLTAPAPGDHYIVSSATIGDGSYGNGDVDLYRMTATAGSRLTAIGSQSAVSAPMDTVLRLFNSDGAQLAADDNPVGLDSRLDFTFLTAGTYYVGISGAGNADYDPNSVGNGAANGSTGDYRLDMSVDAGDTLGTAAATGLVLAGSFTQPSASLGDGPLGSSDVDLYQFTAPPGSTLKAVTTLPAGGTATDTVLRLFNSTGTPLAANDDFADLYSRLDYTFAALGTYYIGVSGAGNAGYEPNGSANLTAGSTGDYRLDLSLDIGDTKSTATATTLAGTGSFTYGAARLGDGHWDSLDVDMFQFSAAANSVLMAVTSQPAGSASTGTYLRLFDSDGNPLAAEYESSGMYSRLHYVFAASGTFYIGVSGEGNVDYDAIADGTGTSGTTGDFRLDLTLTALAVGELELSTLLANNADASTGFVFDGIESRGALGSPRFAYEDVGDVNDDGIDDLLLAAPGYRGTPFTDGFAYLIFGKSGGFDANQDLLDLKTLSGTGYVIHGAEAGDLAGFRGGDAGDLNHDGISDVAIGAIWASPSSDRLNAGQTFVLFGGTNHLAALDLADGHEDGRIELAELASLNGADGFVINGAAAGDLSGTVTTAGDVNGDGIDDLLMGASEQAVPSPGKAYVVFGRDSVKGQSYPAVFDLSSLNGSNGFTIPGLGTSDELGTAIAGAGDLNGDGIDDLIFGAALASPTGRTYAGQAFVIFGQRSSFPATFALASLNGSNGFTVNGNLAFENVGGYWVDAAGDVNRDGVDDVIIGAYGVTVSGLSDAGTAYVLFGKVTATQGSFPAAVEVSSLTGANGFAIRGIAAGDQAGYYCSGVGDVNRDGYDDLLVGAPGADPHGVISAGQSYVVYGAPSFGPNFDLGRLLAANGGDGGEGLVFNGYYASGGGGSIAGIGDINDDGFADLRVGASGVDLNDLTDAGQVYIIYGKPTPPRIRVMPATGLVTSESAGTARFSVMLTTQPKSDVTIPVSTTDRTEGTLSVSSLTFTSGNLSTPGNWSTPQTVTITGVDDVYADDDIAYTILLGEATSGDPDYDGRNPFDVSVTNIDSEIVTTTFTKTENASIPDLSVSGRIGTYTSSLAVAPAGRIVDLDVRVNITHGRDQNLDVFLIAPDGSRTELFTDVGGEGANFTNTVLDDEAVTPITSGWAPFTGIYLPEGNLTVLEGKNLAGTWKLEVSDDERWFTGTLVDWSITARYTSASASGPQVVVTPTSGLVTTEAGGTASFTVWLDTSPTDPVSIPVSSSNANEGTVSKSNLVFDKNSWNVGQRVTVVGVDDVFFDGNVGYTIVLGPAVSDDPDFNGLNPTDVSVTNTDNDSSPTKFYVVNDDSQDRTYEYNPSGALVESHSLTSANTAPRGAASTIIGTKTWVVDANGSVYVYDNTDTNSGALLGSWTAGTLATSAMVEGIATDGTDVWIVDANSDKVYKYTAAATRLSGSQNAASSFKLNSANNSPKDIVTDGVSLWVVNDSTTDKVFKYTTAGKLVSSWTMTTSGATSPTGITIDPANPSSIWIVDSGADCVYQYNAAANLANGSSKSAVVSFSLAAGNTNPQGIADPPVPGSELAADLVEVLRDEAAETVLDATWDPHPVRRTSLGSHRVALASSTRRVTAASRGVDEVMSRLGNAAELIQRDTHVARWMHSNTRRATLDVNLELFSDELDATIGLIADDLTSVGPNRR